MVGGTAQAQLRVAVISDLNGHYGSKQYHAAVPRAIARIREMKPDLALCLGDMIAGQRRRPPFTRPELKDMWRSFHSVVSDPLESAGVPFAVTPGNHDASAYPGSAPERQVFQEEWKARKPGVEFVDARGYPFQYAFAAGPVLFIALDGTRTGTADQSAKQWLKRLLTERAAGYRWRVVFSHVPLFPFVHADQRETVSDPELEAILQQGGVHVVLSGHHHAYYPGVAGGIIWVSQACLGSGPRTLSGASKASPRAFTLIDFPAQGRLRIDALREPDFREAVDLRDLPGRIRAPRRELVRLDRVMSAPEGR
jgi:3',5'-cyclic AMP phosphodiesterase CpdA